VRDAVRYLEQAEAIEGNITMSLRVFARAVCSSSSMPSSLLRVSSSHLFSTSSATQQPSSSQLRRRRRRGSKATDNNYDNQSNNKLIPDDPSISSSIDTSSTLFSPKDSKGNLLNSQEYLQLASLSPWVPCPDMVIKRVFEIANANTNDKHVDLGCGDGRLNFAAISTFGLKNSLGIDIDVNILEKCYERLGKRYVPGRFGTTSSSIGHNDQESISSEADKLDFVQADLIRVIERQKTKYKEQLLSFQGNTLSISKKGEVEKVEDWSKEDEITQQISQSTIITMYFVDEALQQIQPYLASVVGGRTDVCVITIGYEMKGWEPSWVERVLGLTIFKYDMINVANDPVEWSTTVVGNTKEYEVKKDDNSSDQPHLDTYTDVDEPPELSAYLQQKREQDIEELNNGLRIHHDEALNDFTQSKTLQQAQSSVTTDSSSMLYEGTDYEEDDDWDFDEDENPEELLKQAQQIMAEQRSGGRPKGMRAGLDENEKSKKKSTEAKKKPVWKKP